MNRHGADTQHDGEGISLFRGIPPFSTLRQGLVAAWLMEEAEGQTRLDSIGSNHLLDTNTVGVTTGVIGNAANFVSTSNEYLATAGDGDLNFGDADFSFSGWVYLDIAINGGIIFRKGFTAFEYQLTYSSAGGGALGWRVRPASGGDYIQSVVITSLGPTGSWIHFYCEHDSVANTIKIHVNDSLENSLAAAGPLTTNSGEPFYVAGLASSSWMDGRVDELYAYNRILTPSEITESYNLGAGKRPPGL